MPDPLAFLTGLGIAALVSATCALAMAAVRWPPRGWNAALTVAISIGMAFGAFWIGLRWQWPPPNGLSRFLVIVLPAAAAIELAGSLPRVSTRVLWTLRGLLALAIPRILLHGSVHLGSWGLPSVEQPTGLLLTTSGGLLLGVWWLLDRAAQRSPGASIPLTLVLATLCGGLCVLLAGYLKGGAAAFPVAGAVAGATLAARWNQFRTAPHQTPSSSSLISLGLIGLYGLLFVGCAFGRLSLSSGLAIFIAPLACWGAELKVVRRRPAWVGGLLRLVLVAIPLWLVLALAKRDFDRNLAPLLSGTVPTPVTIGRART